MGGVQPLQDSSPIRSLCVAASLGMLALIPAQGAVTLTIDAFAKTLTWSGTATSDSFVIQEDDAFYVRLGIGDWIGGTITGTGSGSLGASLNGVSGPGVFLSSSSFEGEVVVASVRNSIYTDLGSVQNFGGFSEGPATVSMSLTGDGLAYSYANLVGAEADYLESLNGTQLYFQDDQGGQGVFNFGGPAGQIVVIPEVSSALFVLAAPFAFLRRRRGGATV